MENLIILVVLTLVVLFLLKMYRYFNTNDAYTKKEIMSNATNSKCIETLNDGVQLKDCNGSMQQEWSYDIDAKTIMNTETKNCMSYDKNSNAVLQKTCSGNGEQMWNYNNEHQLQSDLDHSKCISAENRISIADCDKPSVNQFWHFMSGDVHHH